MSCESYQKYELGETDEKTYQEHVQSCPLCQKLQQQDAMLLSTAKTLDQPINAPLLWGKIEKRLQAEKQRQRFIWRISIPKQTYPILRIAAVLVLVVGLGWISYYLIKSRSSDSGILTGSRLERIETIEKEYIDAITELEQAAVPQLAQVDTDIMLLYRDRLDTIDAQIQHCKEALENNPANAHIRRYLLAALQDKQQTLKEILKFQS